MGPLLSKMCRLAEGAENIGAFLVHPERMAEVWRDLGELHWRNLDTGEIIEGLPKVTKPFTVNGVPIYEDRVFVPLYTEKRERVEFYVRYDFGEHVHKLVAIVEN